MKCFKSFVKLSDLQIEKKINFVSLSRTKGKSRHPLLVMPTVKAKRHHSDVNKMIPNSAESEGKREDTKSRFPAPAVPQVTGTLPLRGPGLLKGLQICDLIPSSEQTNTGAPA